MDYIAIFLLAAVVVLTFFVVRFFKREAAKDRALLALFEPGNVVVRSGHRYKVLRLELGCAIVESLDGGDIRMINLMTGAGTYRNSMVQYWSQANGVKHVPA